jgi:ribosomal protein S18 acetylase RimI-like enzyme
VLKGTVTLYCALCLSFFTQGAPLTNELLPPVVLLTSDEQLAEVAALLALCREREGAELLLGLDAPVERRTIFGYVEGGLLLGALAAVDWGGGPELLLLVHPEHRRKGVGRALLAAAQAELARRGAADCLLVGQRQVASGAVFAEAVGAELRFSEHRLVLDPAHVSGDHARHPELRLRPATADEIDVMARIQAAAFGDSEDDTRAHVTDGMQMSNRQYFLGELAGEPIGVLRIGRYGGETADVTSFGVLPEHQGRGYGRQMLGEAVRILLGERWPEIVIEVETENANALGLYQSVGFVVASTFDYYGLKTEG